MDDKYQPRSFEEGLVRDLYVQCRRQREVLAAALRLEELE